MLPANGRLTSRSPPELYYADKKVGPYEDLEALFRQLQAAPYFRLVPCEPEHALDFAADQSVPEMHDRIISGLARRLAAPLITSDPQIVAAGVTATVW